MNAITSPHMELNGKIAGNDVLVLALREDNLDAGNVREFKEAMHAQVQGHSKVVLDLSGVKFIDSSGLGALIACLRGQHERRGDLRLCEMSRTVRALFELMRMHRVFSIHPTCDEAVRSYG